MLKQLNKQFDSQKPTIIRNHVNYLLKKETFTFRYKLKCSKIKIKIKNKT